MRARLPRLATVGAALAAGISGARLVELPDAAHLYTTDDPGADEAVLEFIAAL